MPEGTSPARPAPAPTPGAAPAKKSRKLLWIVLSLLVLAAASVAIFLYLRTQSKPYRLRRMQEEAQLHLRLGKVAEAETVLIEAVKLGSDIPALAVQLATAQESLGKPALAEATLRDALKRSPNSTDVARALAAHLLARGRAQEADALLEPIMDKLRRAGEGDERARSLLLAGRAAAASGAGARAQGLLLEAATAAQSPALQAEAQLVLAEVHAEAGDLAAAETAAVESRRLDPSSRGALGHARILERAGRPLSAVDVLKSYHAAGGERKLDVVPALAELLGRVRDIDGLRDLAESVAKDPNGLALAPYVRGTLALAEGDAPGAESEFTRMAELLPKSALPRLLAARVAMRTGAADRARSSFEAALAIDPANIEAQLSLLAIDERAGEPEVVRARAEKLLSEPSTRVRAARALLATYARERDFAGGLAQLEGLRKRFPDDAVLKVNEAVFRVISGDAQRGIADLTALAEKEPDLPGAFAVLASAQESSSDAQEAIDQLAAIAAKDPRFASARVVLAGIYERLGRQDLAVRELDAAIADRPDLSDARLARARIAASQGDLPRAIAEVEKLREKDPKDLRILNLAADLRINAGDAAGARPLLERARDREPASGLAHARLARALALSGDATAALASYESARTREPRLPAGQEDGALLLDRGDTAGAKAALQRALEATGDPRFAAALGAVTALAGDARKALEPLSLWRTRNARVPEGAIVQAMLLAAAGDAQRAEATAATAGAPPEVRASAARVRKESLQDRNARAVLEMFALGVLGWGPEARMRAERIGKDAGADAVAVWTALRSVGNAPDAAQGRTALARKLATLAPSEPFTSLELAGALVAAKDQAGELATLKALKEKFPESPEVALQLGMALERRGDKVGALEQYGRAAAAPQPSPIALNNLAYLLSSDPGKLPIAIETARRAARAAPKVGEVLDTLGWLLFLDDQAEEAEQTLTRALAAAPSHPTIRYHLALVLEARGEAERAANHVEVALLATRDFPELAEAKALLQRLRAEAALSSGAGAAAASAVEVTIPGKFAGKTDKDGVLVARVAAGAAQAETSLRVTGPAGAPSALSIVLGGRTEKRVNLDPGATAILPRLAVKPGSLLVMRASGKGAGAAFSLAFEAVDPALAKERELEPDEATRDARVIAAGEGVAGSLDGAADRDCVRLGLAAGARGALSIEAGPRADLRLEVLLTGAGQDRAVKLGRLKAGEKVRIAGLSGPAKGALALRVSAGSALAAPAGGAAVGAGVDWRARLEADDPAASDAEPNDRLEDAGVLTAGSSLSGSLGRLDEIDWLGVKAPEGEVLSLRISSKAPKETPKEGQGPAPKVVVELWERNPERALPARRYVLAAGATVEVPRWRTPREGQLLVALGGDGPYEVRVEKAAPTGDQGETEPNDRPALADAATAEVAFSGRIDVEGDRDWIRTPTLEAERGMSLRLETDPKFTGIVSIFSRPDREPRLVAAFDAAGGAFEVPALRLPDGPAAIVIAAAGQAPPDGSAGYKLTVGAAPDATGLEIEPNNDPASAIDLPLDRPLRGRISGRADKDLLRIDGRKPFTVKAMGAAAVRVTVRREGGSSKDVAMGASVKLDAATLGGEERVLVEIGLAFDVVPGKETIIPAFTGPVTYEATSGGER